MFNINLTIGTFENAKKLANIALSHAEDIDIKSGRFIIDCKSVLGIFSLDISKPITLCVHTDSTEVAANITNELHEAGII